MLYGSAAEGLGPFGGLKVFERHFLELHYDDSPPCSVLAGHSRCFSRKVFQYDRCGVVGLLDLHG